jgi:hypothetical protein
MLFSSYASFASIVNTLASYHIGSNPVGLESTQSFAKANLPISLSIKASTKHSPSIGLFALEYYFLFLHVHLSIGV